MSRQPSDDEPLAALVFKIITDPHRGPAGVFSRLLRPRRSSAVPCSTPTRRKQRADRAHPQDARQQTRRARGGLGGRHRRRRWPEATPPPATPSARPVTPSSSYGDGASPSRSSPWPSSPRPKPTRRNWRCPWTKLQQEDPTFRVHTDQDTGQTLISGMGELHLEIITDRLKREFSVRANIGRPQVAYKESITLEAEAEGRFVRQSGGRGQYGVCKIKIRPCPDEHSGVQRQDRRRSHPSRVHQAGPSRDRGSHGNRADGGLSDLMHRVSTSSDGSYHDVDSSEVAFKIAGSMAFQNAVQEGAPGAARASDGGRGCDPGGLHGRGDRRPHVTSAAGCRSMEARSGAQVITGKVPLGRDVWLRHGSEIDQDPGPRQLHNAV